MDLGYILFNTLVYGIIAFVFANFFAYGKFLNLSIGAFAIMVGYILYGLVTNGFSLGLVTIGVVLIAFWIAVNRLIVSSFKNTKQRDLFGLIFTLGISILLENTTNWIFGPNSVSFSGMGLSLPVLIALFVFLNGSVRYIFGQSYFGKIMKGVYENGKTMKSLGFRVNRNLYGLFLSMFVLLAAVAVMILIEGNMRASDNIFYMIKGIGIMILVGIGSKQYVFWGALLYVLLEYWMFISMGWPIAYKETLILVIILFVLIFKPEGLFSFGKRKF